MDNLRTFTYGSRRVPTLGQALNWNEMMQDPSFEFLRAQESHGTSTPSAVDSRYLPELWAGLMGSIDLDDATTVLPACVNLTMPIEYMSIIRNTAGVTAAFAYCEIVKQLTQVKDLTDDLDVRGAMARAWVKFDDRVQEANNVREGFGCDDSQSWHTLRDIGDDPKSEKLKVKLMAIAKLAGRMYESFGYQYREHPNNDPEEVVGASVGPDMDRIVTSELALLADEDTEDMQAMKILQGQATITEMEGKEQKSRGPLVLTVDESGSMHDGDLPHTIQNGCARWAGRNTWAKACCVALTRIAWSENRPVRVVHFGRGTVVQEIPKDDTRALFEMARSFLSGGTSFGGALKRARAVVGDLKDDGFAGADIMIITDGEDTDEGFHNDELDAMQVAGIKLWTVAIGLQISEDAPVRKRCERYTYAQDRDLGSHETAANLAQGLDKAAMGNEPGAGGMIN